LDIGIPLERSDAERRVALTPAGVDRLVRAGHRVFVERSAGAESRFGDDEYLAAGAQLSYTAEEVYGRADLLVKVLAPAAEEYGLLREDGALMCFLAPSVAPPEGFRTLLDRRVSAIAMEMIEDRLGNAPVLRAMSEIAGPMAIHIAAHLLATASGGRGVLLGGAPGIPPAAVVILGAGVVGTTAARTALGNGAQVTVLDSDVDRLRSIEAAVSNRVTTMLADEYHVSRAVQFADALIGAVMIRWGRTPHLVSESMVGSMKPGSVVVDVSIDQGGCLETSRPTSILDPTYVWGGVVHYAVPNMAANVARTATRALTNASLPYVLDMADRGVAEACMHDRGLGQGIVTARGRCLHPTVAERFHVPADDPVRVLAEHHVSS
jgi:alanine dehydrogenase